MTRAVNVCPETLATVNPEAEVDRDLDNIDPAILAKVMKIIARWSSIDTKLSGFVANLTHGDHWVVARMVAAIENDGARHAAIKAAAKEVLSTQQYETYVLPVMEKVRDKRRDRNVYAHSILASSPDIADALLLIDSREWSVRSAHYREWQIGWSQWYRHKQAADRRGAPPPNQSDYLPESDYPPPEDIIVRPVNEIEAHLEVANRVHNLTSLLSACFGQGPEQFESHPLLSLLRKELRLPPSDTDPSAQTK